MSQIDAAAFATLEELEIFLRRMDEIPCEEECLSELAHGLQCAQVLQVMAPADAQLQIAGLLHDVGQAQGHAREHGRIGGLAIQGLFGERVAELVRLHVDAKRYLVTNDPAYRAKLSPVSIETLELQGGTMRVAESAAFAASPFCKDAIRLRQADDLAKIPGKATLGLEAWLPLLQQVSLR